MMNSLPSARVYLIIHLKMRLNNYSRAVPGAEGRLGLVLGV